MKLVLGGTDMALLLDSATQRAELIRKLASSEQINDGDLKAMEHEIRSYLALDRPRHIRYLTWIGNLLQGDLGRSIGSHIGTQKAVKDLVGDRIGLTVALTGFTATPFNIKTEPTGFIPSCSCFWYLTK